jgi:hypothetical protein
MVSIVSRFLFLSLFLWLCINILCVGLQEVHRIKREHPDDDQCIVNDRVKGRLKVTRAFGAGYLKQVIVILFEWVSHSFNLILILTMFVLCGIHIHLQSKCICCQYFVLLTRNYICHVF